MTTKGIFMQESFFSKRMAACWEMITKDAKKVNTTDPDLNWTIALFRSDLLPYQTEFDCFFSS